MTMAPPPGDAELRLPRAKERGRVRSGTGGHAAAVNHKFWAIYDLAVGLPHLVSQPLNGRGRATERALVVVRFPVNALIYCWCGVDILLGIHSLYSQKLNWRGRTVARLWGVYHFPARLIRIVFWMPIDRLLGVHSLCIAIMS